VTVYIVLAHKPHESDTVAAFTEEAAASAYAAKQTALEKQRHPHPAATWKVMAVDVDALM
jgi:hypothetical protein